MSHEFIMSDLSYKIHHQSKKWKYSATIYKFDILRFILYKNDRRGCDNASTCFTCDFNFINLSNFLILSVFCRAG